MTALIVIPTLETIAFGTVTLNINVFGRFSFQDVLWRGSDMEVTWAALITVLAVGCVWQNRNRATTSLPASAPDRSSGPARI